MVAELIAETGVLKGIILSLAEGEEWTLGRDPDVSMIVLDDPQVSRLHLRIRKRGERFFIENLSDTNPVLVKEEPLTAPTPLEEGDLVSIGNSVFRFYPTGLSDTSYTFTQETSYEDRDHFTEEILADKGSTNKRDKNKKKASSPPPAFTEREGEDEFGESDHLFREPDEMPMHVDLSESTRFILKVISGPNAGAEFALDPDQTYLLGTDTTNCDIVFNDLSVSREHARIRATREGTVTIEDLGSRNGVLIDKQKIGGIHELSPNTVVSLGTSAFLLIDREAPSETIVTPLLDHSHSRSPERPTEAAVHKGPRPEMIPPVPPAAELPPPKKKKQGTLILSLILSGLAVMLGMGLLSLFQSKHVEVSRKDHLADVEAAMKPFSATRFTYNATTGKLFLVGHVKTGIEHNELLHQIRALGFVTGIEDNIVNDEAVWQEMNILLSKHPDFQGVSMHSPQPGLFVVNGYLQSEKQAAHLTDYLNLNFNYLDGLDNRVVVEQAVIEEVGSCLASQGLAAVHANMSNGELQLTGYVGTDETVALDKAIEGLKKIPGVRHVRNYVVPVTPELGVIDLNRKHMSKAGLPRYRVTGYSKHGNVNINVVINGRIVGRGDCIDGYTVTGIQTHTVFLEREGLKYKLEYNKCKPFMLEE